MRVNTHEQWFRSYTIPCVLLTVVVALWGTAIGVGVYRMLGVTLSSVGGRPATFVDKLMIHGIEMAIPCVMLHCLLLLCLCIGRVRFRWWLVVAFLIILGTPVALFSGWHIADYLWTRNQGGEPWEGFLPQVIGLLIAWILSIPASMMLSRYRFIIIQRHDQRRSPCPRCGYELFGSSGRCPECGWEVPASTASTTPPN